MAVESILPDQIKWSWYHSFRRQCFIWRNQNMCYIFEYQSNENQTFRFYWDTQYNFKGKKMCTNEYYLYIYNQKGINTCNIVESLNGLMPFCFSSDKYLLAAFSFKWHGWHRALKVGIIKTTTINKNYTEVEHSKVIFSTVKAPVIGTLNGSISNFQTWFVRTVMEVLKYCWM